MVDFSKEKQTVGYLLGFIGCFQVGFKKETV